MQYVHSILRSKFNKSNIIDEHCEGLLPTGTSEHGERGARNVRNFLVSEHAQKRKAFLTIQGNFLSTQLLCRFRREF